MWKVGRRGLLNQSDRETLHKLRSLAVRLPKDCGERRELRVKLQIYEES